MSHFSINVVKLENINREVFLQALKKMCERLGYEVVDEIRDYHGLRLVVGRDIDFAFRSSRLYRGVGVKLTGKGFQVVGDFYKTGMTVGEMTELIQNTYIGESVSMALQELGFMNIQENIHEQGIVTIEASGW